MVERASGNLMSNLMSNHDVYHQWLGIPPDQQPPTLYQLLGVARFEKDAEVIRNAAERQALHVRRLARGEFTDVGQGAAE